MNIQTILIVGGIFCLISILINILAFVLEKIYKKKMQKMAEK